jgi:hypothetical protein
VLRKPGLVLIKDMTRPEKSLHVGAEVPYEKGLVK